MLFFLTAVADVPPKRRHKAYLVYDTYAGLVKAVCMRILRNEALAEEALQESFLRIFKNLHKISEVSSHKTRSFVVIISRNTALHVLKQEQKHHKGRVEAEPELLPLFNEPVYSPAEGKELQSVLAALPDIHKDILELKIYQELSDRAAAELLGISPGAVRKRLQRAKAAVLQLLKENYGDETYEKYK